MCILGIIQVMKGEAWMRRLAGVLVWLLTLSGMVLQAGAAERTGSIRVQMTYGEQQPWGSVALHYLGEPVQGDFRLRESLGGGIICREDVQSPELAQWLSQRTGEGEVRYLDADGCGEFTGLTEGLYLLTQTEAPEGYACADPFLIPIPLDGQWEVLACPKISMILTESPKTGQHPAPLIGAMGLILSGMGLWLCVEKLRKK